MQSGLSEMPEELRALITLVPSNVKIERLSRGYWKVEAEVHYTKNGKEFRGTCTRWMSPWAHSVQDWADAVMQVARDASPD